MVEAEGRRFPFDGVEKIQPELLDTFPYEFPGREAEIVISTGEWNCVCPFSGLPDFGTLTIRYVPDAMCLELRALKYYLTSYRTVGIYQEHAANHVLGDLVAACRPRRMEIELDYRLRGGIHTVVTVRFPVGSGERGGGRGRRSTTPTE
jgi:7-cyano-7-deazaguanine reductase